MCLSQGKEKMADMRRRTLSRNSKSDHLTIVNAFQVRRRTSLTSVFNLWPLCDSVVMCLIEQGWEDAKHRGARYEREYCWDNFLSANTLQVSQSDYECCV